MYNYFQTKSALCYSIAGYIYIMGAVLSLLEVHMQVLCLHGSNAHILTTLVCVLCACIVNVDMLS